jgi:arginine deiminase
MKPLLNLTFTRDQQIVTNRGLVISNMGSLQRKRETQIMKYCFKYVY